MRTAHLALLACLLAVFGPLASLRASSTAPLHLSLTEANYNRERGRLLINVRVQTADLEAALTARAGRKVTAAEPGDLAPLALEYVREKLRLTSARGETLRLEWAGHDLAEKQLFLFFECPLIGGLQGTRIANTLLLELLPDQLNTVEVRDGAFKATLLFTREATEHNVSAKP